MQAKAIYALTMMTQACSLELDAFPTLKRYWMTSERYERFLYHRVTINLDESTTTMMYGWASRYGMVQQEIVCGRPTLRQSFEFTIPPSRLHTAHRSDGRFGTMQFPCVDAGLTPDPTRSLACPESAFGSFTVRHVTVTFFWPEKCP